MRILTAKRAFEGRPEPHPFERIGSLLDEGKRSLLMGRGKILIKNKRESRLCESLRAELRRASLSVVSLRTTTT